MAYYYKIKGDTLIGLANQGRRLTGASDLMTPSELRTLLSEIDVPLGADTNLDMSNAGVNIVRNTRRDAKITAPGSFSDGCFVVTNGGYLSTNCDFMNNNGAWTIAFVIDSYIINPSVKHCRIARGENDVPSIYSWSDYEDYFFFKLASSRVTPSLANWYNENVLTIQNASLAFKIPNNSKTMFAFRNDEEYISLWINGVMAAKQVSSDYSSTYRTGTYYIGDNTTSGYTMNDLKCSTFKGWNRALADWEMELLVPDNA